MKKWYVILIVLLAFTVGACQRSAGNGAAADTTTTGDTTLGAEGDTATGDTTMESTDTGTGDTATTDTGTGDTTTTDTATGDQSLGAGGDLGTFSTWDTDGDGFISQAEWDTTSVGDATLGAGDFFTAWDANGDGQLDESEFNSGWSTR